MVLRRRTNVKARNIITAVLLLFVAVSVVFLVASEARRSSSQGGVPDPTGTTERTVPGGNDVQSAGPAKVIAYYFYGDVRCATCRAIEAYSREAIELAFSSELKAGTLQWRTVNVQEPGNGHFVDDYKLVTRSLVLVDVSSGGPGAWKNLDAVWSLVRNKEAFQKYVRDEVRAFLGER